MPTISILIKGRVQGVFYRASAKQKAGELGITGWVRNTDDGYVEAVATGSEEQLQQFTDWCKKGPPQAVVSEIQVKSMEERAFGHFTIARN